MRKTWRTALRLFGGVVLLGLLAAAYLVLSEWTYISRLRTHPATPITSVDWFTPKQRVTGEPRGDLPIAAPGEAGIAPDSLAEAWAYAQKKNSSALLVVRHGKLALEKYAQGRAGDSWTDSASMAKTICAILIGIAVDEGKIPSIDVPAATYLAEWRSDGRKSITIRHLLEMHSGLRPMGEYTDPFSDACYLALGTDARSVVANCPLVTTPGRQFDYNNVNFQALDFVIEAATGKPYAEYLSEKLWRPLGNYDAALWLDHRGGCVRTYGYLFARAQDWARVGLLLLNAGEADGRRIVSRNWVRQMLIPSPGELDYGLGVWLGREGSRKRDRDEELLARGMFYLDGKDKQRVYVIPSRDLVIVRVGEQAHGWDEAALPNAVLRGTKN